MGNLEIFYIITFYVSVRDMPIGRTLRNIRVHGDEPPVLRQDFEEYSKRYDQFDGKVPVHGLGHEGMG
jgi:hypothetical protein